MLSEYDLLNKVCSQERIQKYMDANDGDPNKAVEHYKCNVLLSESLYPSLNTIEIALRNSLSREMKKLTGRDDWYEYLLENPAFEDLFDRINEAKRKLADRKEVEIPSKVIAELTFGFWVSLLNSKYEMLLWKQLRFAFPDIAKDKKQRKYVANPLNNIRKLRNRTYHNEPICWSLVNVEELHNQIMLVLAWINRDMPQWLVKIDRFDDVCLDVSKRMNWKK